MTWIQEKRLNGVCNTSSSCVTKFLNEQFPIVYKCNCYAHPWINFIELKWKMFFCSRMYQWLSICISSNYNIETTHLLAKLYFSDASKFKPVNRAQHPWHTRVILKQPEKMVKWSQMYSTNEMQNPGNVLKWEILWAEIFFIPYSNIPVMNIEPVSVTSNECTARKFTNPNVVGSSL